MKIDALGLLGVVFIVLKITDYIDWSWWVVTMPFWFGGVFVLFLVLIALINKYKNR